MMKKNVLKTSLIAVLLVVFVGCDDHESDSFLLDEMDSKEAALSAKIDNASEVLSDAVVQVYEFEESLVKNPKHPHLPDCAVISVETMDASKIVTVDFGTEGCELRNGRVLKGKVIMSYNRDVEAMSKTIMYALENFFIDDILLEGSKTVTRQKVNDHGNPQYSMDLDLGITFADGVKASRTGTKVREWIEGIFNGNWGGNIFLITGAWSTSFANGNIHSTTITVPLRREASCKFLVSGTVELIRTNYTGILDYGDGACDNIAIFTNVDGEEREIRL